MTDDPTDPQRRALLLSAMGLVLSGGLLEVSTTMAGAKKAEGQIGDFNFLAGRWKIHHRRLKGNKRTEWDEFDGEATCWTVLGGAGSIEELRIPARDFSGLGIRLLDPQTGLWADFWVNGRDRVLTGPPTTGVFENGVGAFIADDVDDGHPIKVKGVWDKITPKSCRWYQATSRDGGKSWEENWIMEWTRV